MHDGGTPDQLIYNLALKTLDRIGSPIACSFRQNFPNVNTLSIIDLEPTLLPVSELVEAVGSAAASTRDLVNAVQATYHKHQWRQPYRLEDFGEAFFHSTAWFPIADKGGPLCYGDGLMEIMLLDAYVTYPEHKHRPEELYVILAGQVWWSADNQQPCLKYAGDVIHHKPNVIHSIRSHDKPALILSLWRGGGFEMPVITRN